MAISTFETLPFERSLKEATGELLEIERLTSSLERDREKRQQ
jgi:hypothetical protein